MEGATVHSGPLAHPRQPAASDGIALTDVVPRSAVENLELERALSPAHDDAGRRAAGVFEHVCECFLDDPVGGDRDAAGQGARLTLNTQLYLEAGLLDVLDQRRDLGHSRLRRQWRVDIVV